MHTTELLERLGLSGTDRAVVLHADDIGMCEATVSAYREIAMSPVVSAASAMVPCAWFPSIAQMCQDPDRTYDIGVHLTLNSEWESYRWRPITRSGSSALVDCAGFLPRTAAELHGRGDVQAAVYSELTAQIDHAVAMGVDVTHIDSHMLTMFAPLFVDTYRRLSREYRLPNGLLRMAPLELQQLCKVSAEDAAVVCQMISRADSEDLVVFDRWAELPLGDASEPSRLESATRLLDGLPVGLSLFVMHPAAETQELKAIAPDWAARVADYRLCLSDKWINTVDAAGVQVVGMRAVRSALFGEPATRTV